MENLSTAWAGISQKAYQSKGNDQSAGQPQQEPTKEKDEQDVEDADFEVVDEK